LAAGLRGLLRGDVPLTFGFALRFAIVGPFRVVSQDWFVFAFILIPRRKATFLVSQLPLRNALPGNSRFVFAFIKNGTRCHLLALPDSPPVLSQYRCGPSPSFALLREICLCKDTGA
jgi:hypothetical protein